MRSAESRRRRIQRLKKSIVLALLLFISVPAVLCAFLFAKVRGMDREMGKLAGQVELLTEETAAQREMLQELLDHMQTTVQVGQEENIAGRELEGYELEPPAEEGQGEEEPEAESPEAESPETESLEAEGAEASPAHKVYLTFDDGPSSNTEEILDILDQYGVKATFFVVGKEGDWAEEALADIVRRGHSLGMHSYTHKYAEIYQSLEVFAEDFVKLREYLEDVTGVTSGIYRFPGGSSNTVSDVDMHEFAAYLESWDVRFFDWNVSSGDGGRKLLTVDELVENSLEGISNRETSIILLHDAAGKTTTVEALPEIIEKIQAMEDTVILPITEDTEPVQHIHMEGFLPMEEDEALEDGISDEENGSRIAEE